MKKTDFLLGFAGVIAMAALAAGCVPALDYGSVPPEPEYTTKYSMTAVETTTRKPFTTHSHAPHTISWGDYYGYATKSSTKSKSTTTGTGTDMTYHTTSGDEDDDVIDFGYTTKGTGTTASGETARPETQVTATVPSGETQQTDAAVTAPPETAPPQTAPPETAPPQTAPPETAPPQTAAPPPQTGAPAPDIIE